MRRVTIALLGIGILAVAGVAQAKDPVRPNPENFRIGLDEDALPADYRGYNRVGAAEIDNVEMALTEICPCLYIRVVTEGVRNGLPGNAPKPARGSIIIREPRDIDDLKNIPKFPNKNRLQIMVQDFCDCYEKHRAGCNLIWSIATLSTAQQPTTIWRARVDDENDDGGGNRHRRGNIGWNPFNPRGGATDASGRGKYRPVSVGLAHELAHAYHSLKKVNLNQNSGDRLGEEFSAVRAENQIRAELNAQAEEDGDRNTVNRTKPRTGYALGGKNNPVPDNTGQDIDVSSFFEECDKKPKLALPKGGGGKEPPRQSGLFVPGQSGELVVPVSLDSGRWCSYGDGVGEPTTLIPIDDFGRPLVPGGPVTSGPSETPFAPGGPIVVAPPPSTPTIASPPPGQPTPPAGAPPEAPTATPPETPVAGPPSTPPSQPPGDKPPEQVPPTVTAPPASVPPETPVIIFVKATQTVLEGQPQGIGLPGLNTALFPATKPDLPFSNGGTQTAQQDVGFDKDPVKCTTGQGGECKLELDTGTLKDYGIGLNAQLNLNQRGGSSNYRLDYSVPQTVGGVVETTGLKALPDLEFGLPNVVNLSTETFNIGDRSFLRLGFDQPFGLDFGFDGHYAKLLGGSMYLSDYCRDKQPGPPLGAQPASFSALNQALPEATVHLRLSILDRLRASTIVH
jgi:hypothetical protein